MFAWAVAGVATIAAVTFATMTYLGHAPIWAGNLGASEKVKIELSLLRLQR